jgi:hypothetical protein
MTRLNPSKDSRTTYDEKTGAVRSFFGSELVAPLPEAKRALSATSKGEDFLEVNRDLFKLENITLQKADVSEGAHSRSVRYLQLHNDIPVYGAQFVVGQAKEEGTITSAVNNVDYSLPAALGSKKAKVSADQAVELIHKQFGNQFEVITLGQPTLYIYRHITAEMPRPKGEERPIRKTMLEIGTGSVGKVYLAWQVLMDTKGPGGNWELFMDATNGKLLAVRDTRRYISRKGYVFWPDPIRSKQDSTLSWKTSESILNQERKEVDLENLKDPGTNPCKLISNCVECAQLDSPVFPQPESNGDFKYGAKQSEFSSVMAYYYLDQLIHYLLTLGCVHFNDNVKKVKVDAQGGYYEDSSSGPNSNGELEIRLAIGDEPSGRVPDASDPAVPVHEYGHSIYDILVEVPDTFLTYSYEQGWCDFLAGCWLDRYNEHQYEREEVFPWDNCKTVHWDETRTLNRTEKFYDKYPETGEPYIESNDRRVHDLKGDIFATALWDWFLNIGGNSDDPNVRRWAADEVIRTYLDQIVIVQVNQPADTLAKGLISADASRTGGIYKKVIWDAFRRRGLWDNFTDVGNVDLYIKDSDMDTGEQASPQIHWTSPDIWVRNNPPTDPGENPDDGHQPPINNVPNYLYVRVRNRGSQDATANTFSVEAFHCSPATAMLWPIHFQSMGSLKITNAIAANGGYERIGPFIWTPQIVDHECLVAIVNGPSDPTIADSVKSKAAVDHWKLVRFDNNVGQRNVEPKPTTPGGKTKVSFLVRGTTHPSTNTLRLDAKALPPDTKIRVRVARSIADQAKKLSGLALDSQNSRWSTWALAGGATGMIVGFPLGSNEEKDVTLEIDFSYQAEHMMRYPIVVGQDQDGVLAGQLTVEITAVKESEDFVYGNVHSRELHTLDCIWRKRMMPHNQVPFQNIKDALARDYNGCRYCLPKYSSD